MTHPFWAALVGAIVVLQAWKIGAMVQTIRSAQQAERVAPPMEPRQAA